jgi:tRNA threonylcarbamoyl adenosine modification protein YeaZ
VLLLAIDTSTPSVTAGIVTILRPHELTEQLHTVPPRKPVELLSEQVFDNPFAHAERLMPLVLAALADSERRLAEVEAVVVGLGPGPFTGLRVGVATAQALGDALDIAVYGVGSHDAVARAHLDGVGGETTGEFLVVTDARRREVYLSVYSAKGRRLFGPVPISPASVSGALADNRLSPASMIGAGTPLLTGQAGLESVSAISAVGRISTGLALAAARSLLTGAVPGPLTPLYLRRPDATEPGARKSVLGRS